MKYIYYIIAIVIVFSGVAAYGLFDTRLEVSKPFISVNDRIISEKEFERMLAGKPHYMSEDQFADSVIDKQLLIQEAIRMEINKEENFRLSVENFYEQSLIKILLDRKLDALVVDVSSDEIEKYRLLMEYTFFITKYDYPSMDDFNNKTRGRTGKITSDFTDLSDNLKFVVMGLAPGKSSPPRSTSRGVVVYTLDEMKKKVYADSVSRPEFDIKKVSLYIRDQKKTQLMAAWTSQLKQSARIWREK